MTASNAHALAAVMKAGPPQLAVVPSALLTIAIGVVILMHWPVASLPVLGVFLAADLISPGVGWITAGSGLATRSWRTRAAFEAPPSQPVVS